MSDLIKMPEGDVEIGTVEEAFWSDVELEAKKVIEGLEKQLKFNRAILELAEQKIAAEQ